jgi:hypothetical protein
LGGADPDVDAGLARRLGGEADRADLGVGERDPRQRPVVGRFVGLPEDVCGGEAGLVYADVGASALAGEIAPARRLSSAGTNRCVSSIPTVETLRPGRSVRRPVATSS